MVDTEVIERKYYTLPEAIVEINNRLNLVGKEVLSDHTIRVYIRQGQVNFRNRTKNNKYIINKIDLNRLQEVVFYIKKFGVKPSKVVALIDYINQLIDDTKQ